MTTSKRKHLKALMTSIMAVNLAVACSNQRGFEPATDVLPGTKKKLSNQPQVPAGGATPILTEGGSLNFNHNSGAQTLTGGQPVHGGKLNEADLEALTEIKTVYEEFRGDQSVEQALADLEKSIETADVNAVNTVLGFSARKFEGRTQGSIGVRTESLLDLGDGKLVDFGAEGEMSLDKDGKSTLSKLTTVLDSTEGGLKDRVSLVAACKGKNCESLLVVFHITRLDGQKVVVGLRFRDEGGIELKYEGGTLGEHYLSYMDANKKFASGGDQSMTATQTGGVQDQGQNQAQKSGLTQEQKDAMMRDREGGSGYTSKAELQKQVNETWKPLDDKNFQEVIKQVGGGQQASRLDRKQLEAQANQKRQQEQQKINQLKEQMSLYGQGKSVVQQKAVSTIDRKELEGRANQERQRQVEEQRRRDQMIIDREGGVYKAKTQTTSTTDRKELEARANQETQRRLEEQRVRDQQLKEQLSLYGQGKISHEQKSNASATDRKELEGRANQQRQLEQQRANQLKEQLSLYGQGKASVQQKQAVSTTDRKELEARANQQRLLEQQRRAAQLKEQLSLYGQGKAKAEKKVLTEDEEDAAIEQFLRESGINIIEEE